MRIRLAIAAFAALAAAMGSNPLATGKCARARDCASIAAAGDSANAGVSVSPFYTARGKASWYGRRFQGRRTASGERFNRFDLTCAHRWLPFGSILRVTNTNNGKSVVVRVNDRGPFVRRRILDLSAAAAEAIGVKGCATVVINAYTDSSWAALNAPHDTAPEATIPQIANTAVRAAVAVSPSCGARARVFTDDMISRQPRRLIVDYYDRPLRIHGYTVSAATSRDYARACAVRDALLARGYRSVRLSITTEEHEILYNVCVGLEPAAIACRMTAERLLPDYPAADITYIESAYDDTNQTTACAN